MRKNTKIIISVIVVLSVCNFITGSIILGASSLYLLSSSSTPSTQYFLTINEVLSNGDKFVDKNIRISGAVIGDSIEIKEVNGVLSFQIAEGIRSDGINDESSKRLTIRATRKGQVCGAYELCRLQSGSRAHPGFVDAR